MPHLPLASNPSSTAAAVLLAADERLLHIVIRLLLGLGLPLSVLGALNQPASALQNSLIPVGIALISLSALWLLRRKRVNATLNVILWGLALLISLQCLLLNGIRSPVAALLPVIVMFTAWSRGTRHTLILCASLIAVLTGMAMLDSTLWPVQVPRSGFQYWTTYCFCMALGAFLASHLARRFQRQHADQLQISLERDASLRALKLEQAKFSSFFYLNPVPVSISLLADGTYYDVNPAWEKLSGWSKTEIIGKTSTQIGLWLTQAERDAWINEFRQGGSTKNSLVRFRLRDGRERYFQASCETVDYDGQACIFAAFVDITERREAEEALRQLNAKLEDRVLERTQRLAEANQSLANTVDSLQRTQDELVHAETMASLGSLVAGISHELNTPLGNALTVVSSLQEQAREMDQRFVEDKITRSALKNFIADQTQGAGIAATNLQRASELVSSFKQVAVDQTSERRRRFDLGDTLTKVIDTLRPGLRFQPVELHCQLPSGLSMDSYPGPLGQIISNLIQNALLHGLANQSAGRIEIEASECDANSLQVVVRDNGCGIPEIHLGRIFDPFFTTRLGQGGSGLGLAIVYRLATTLLGGTITVSSTPGEGTCFTLTLPKVAPGAGA